MSHTGSVIHEDESPGLIRVVTTGYLVDKESKNLIFRKPIRHKEDWKKGDKDPYGAKGENKLRDAQVRFILYDPPKPRSFHYGAGVFFNLEEFNEDEWKKQNPEADLEKIKKSIPDKPDGFEFAYIATDISLLPEEFILHSFYRFISVLNPKSIENVLDHLSKLTEEYKLKRSLRVNMVEGTRTINGVQVMDAKNFDKIEKAYVRDFVDRSKDGKIRFVDDEIEAKGHHRKSTEEEVPTLVA